MTFYELTARYDIPFLAKMNVTNLLTDSWADEQGPASAALSTTAPFTSIFWAHRLTTAYKIRQRKVVLVGGQEYKYLFKARPNFVRMDRYYDSAGAQLLTGERGKYKLLFCQLRGFPCNDAAAFTNVGMSQAAVDWLGVEKVKVHWSQFQNLTLYNYATTIPGSNAVPTIMVEATATGVPVAVA